jgi:hypothetical protein
MKQIAACLLVALGIEAAGHVVDQTRVPLVTWFHGTNADVRDLTADLITDWHFKELHLPKLCFGFCPEMENLP